MNILLDTCAMFALASDTLTKVGRKKILTSPEVYLSPASVWEIAIKIKSGKLALSLPPLEWVEELSKRHGLTMLTGHLRPGLLCRAADLPLIHRDPMDRILIATALEQDIPILTSDRIISEYPGVTTVW